VIHVLHDEALRELREAVEYYKAISPELVADFYQEMERLIHEVCLHPRLFRQFDPPARRHFSNRFPYGIIYLAEPDRVWIIAIMPLKRKPAYWRTRVGNQ
jgi:plasmid stabilization system protein ParE